MVWMTKPFFLRSTPSLLAAPYSVLSSDTSSDFSASMYPWSWVLQPGSVAQSPRFRHGRALRPSSLLSFCEPSSTALDVYVCLLCADCIIITVRAKKFVAWLSVLLIGLGVSLVGYQFGRQLGDPRLYRFRDLESRHRRQAEQELAREPAALTGLAESETAPPADVDLPHPLTVIVIRPASQWRSLTLLDISISIVVLLLLAGSIVLAVFVQDSNAITLSLAMAPAGTLLRWLISIFLNRPRWPYGTLFVNVVGSSLAVTFFILQVSIGRAYKVCLVFDALIVGFCGCLTTVSTFAHEVHVLPARRSLVYITVSIVLTETIQIAIAGIFHLAYSGPIDSTC